MIRNMWWMSLVTSCMAAQPSSTSDTVKQLPTISFKASARPVATLPSVTGWEPKNPRIELGPQQLSPSDQYEVWRQTFGRQDNATERQNFYACVNRTRSQNSNKARSWSAGCNRFAALSLEDWKKIILADNAVFIAAGNAGRRLLSLEEDPFSAASEDHQRKLLQTTSFTWLGKGVLTAVKDQGQCGSCYAHSVSSQMEAQLAIATGKPPVILSREQLKDCSPNTAGCAGGNPESLFVYAASASGVTTEAIWPYVTQDAACRNPLPPGAFMDAGYTAIAANEVAFKAGLASGPLAVTVCADTWSNYANGVFANCPSNCVVNHAVLLVGYGTDATLGDYWLIQNSWGTWWGESGFMRLKRGASSTTNAALCGLTRYSGFIARSPQSLVSSTTTDCQGSWSAWSACTKTCGSGTQSRTWTTTAQPSNGGAACPNPTTESQACNTAACPAAPGSCWRVTNSVLGANGDGNYLQVPGWNQNWCGTSPLPQYQRTSASGETLLLFFAVTSCSKNGMTRTAGQWGLGSTDHAGYQWAAKQSINKGVIPAVNTASWTISITSC